MWCLLDIDPSPRATVFLAGVGRSGTTWVGDVLNAGNDFRIIFEPFHPSKVRLVRHFRYRQYLRPEDDEPAYVRPATTIVEGRLRTVWTDRFNRRIISIRRLIKEIRANLLLKWLKVHFPAITVILLVRHPCAVACSRLRLGWPAHLDEFLTQPELLEDHLKDHLDVIRAAKTEFEKQILLWCIETAVPLRQFSPGEIEVVFYENLCLDPKGEYSRLLQLLGCKFTQKHEVAVQRPSVTAWNTNNSSSPVDLIDGWRCRLDNRQIKRAMSFVDAFGLSDIYGEESRPKILTAHSGRPLPVGLLPSQHGGAPQA